MGRAEVAVVTHVANPKIAGSVVAGDPLVPSVEALSQSISSKSVKVWASNA